MAGLLEKMRSGGIDRRTFIKGATAATAGLMAASALGCSSESDVEKVDENNLPDPDAEGEWIPVACFHNCGGRCSNKALVKDGVVLRQKTDDIYPDDWGEGHFQNRSCQRGHSQQQQCFGIDRIKYPMKRKHWQPGGVDYHGEMRGYDEWEQLSWDEAIDIVASELTRIYDTYGPRSVLFAAFTVRNYHNLLKALGGFASFDRIDSYGTWMVDCNAIGLPIVSANPDQESGNDRLDLPNAEYIVLYSCNPAWASGGSPSYHFIKAREAGTKFIYVGPSRNITASMLDARWIPVRPATDTAFLLAVAYTMLQRDDEEDLIDWDWLHNYCVGFDSESMPDDAVLDENFKDYVLGEYDGIPKTPEWATEICGTPVQDMPDTV